MEEKRLFNGNAVYRRVRCPLEPGRSPYHVIKADLTNAEMFVTPLPLGLSFVPSLLDKHGMDMAINGDGWTTIGLPGFHASRPPGRT